MSEQRIRETYIDQQAVALSVGMAIETPGMYSVGEMAELSRRYDDATAALEEALRGDFRSMPPREQEWMRKLLSKAGERGRQVLEILDGEQVSGDNAQSS